MVDKHEKRRVTQTHMDAIANECGPVYGVRLFKELPLGTGGMIQAMPSRVDLKQVLKMNQRVVAGFEVLTEHYRDRLNYISSLESVIQRVIDGEWTVTELQEIVGQLK